MSESTTYSLTSWNVNGIRAVEKKGFLDWMKTAKQDIVCLQETKAQADQLSKELLHPSGYESYWNSAIRKGYSGTSIYTRISPVLAMTSFSDDVLDGEGRIILLEFKEFYLFNVYFPNGGSGPVRLDFKMKFYDKFLDLIETFRKKKPIVFCGDVNTAHAEIDLARPKENEKTSGFLPKERAWIDRIVEAGYLDTFRLLHPDQKDAYSWWDMKSHARSRNIGWRIDYFFVSKELKKHVVSAAIHDKVHGSDHCPVSLALTF
ncbi:MAG: exodeoxyribonuclease III [Patescibacteria group bacterium]